MRDDTVPYAMRNQAAITMVTWREEYRTVRQRGIEQVVTGIDPFTGEPIVEQQETVQEQRVPKYRGPKIEHVDLRNFVVWPLTIESIENAYLVGHKYRLSADEIKRKVKEGFFDKDALELVDKLVTESSAVEVRQPTGKTTIWTVSHLSRSPTSSTNCGSGT